MRPASPLRFTRLYVCMWTFLWQWTYELLCVFVSSCLYVCTVFISAYLCGVYDKLWFSLNVFERLYCFNFFLCLESSWKQIFVSFIKYLNLIALRRKNTTCLSSSLLIMSHYLSRAAANYVSLLSHAAVGARARPSFRRQLMAPSPCQRVKEHPSASRLPSRPQSACDLWRISWRRCEENELTTSLSRCWHRVVG